MLRYRAMAGTFFLVDGTAMQGGHDMLDLYAQMERALTHGFAGRFHEIGKAHV